MTITEFLEARIAEDERSANMRGGGSHSIHLFDIVGTYNQHCPDCRGLPGKTRVLAECAAKRAVIAEHRIDGAFYGDDHLCTMCNSSGPDAQGWPCSTFRALASVYADHPDYRQEWAL